jgi:hypothetical protein
MSNPVITVESPDITRLKKVFEELQYTDKRKIIINSLNRAVVPVVRQAKANVNVRTGNLQRSVGQIVNRKDLTVSVGARKRNGHKGYHGLLVEKGTVARQYVTKKGNIHKTGKMPALNWLRKATESKGTEANRIVIEEWRKGIDKVLKKYR